MHIILLLIINFRSLFLVILKLYHILFLTFLHHAKTVPDQFFSLLLLLLNGKLISLIIYINTFFSFKCSILSCKKVVFLPTINFFFKILAFFLLNLFSDFVSFSFGSVTCSFGSHLHSMELQVVDRQAIVAIGATFSFFLIIGFKIT